MTDAELLKKIKDGLGIVGDYQDATLMIYIEDVKSFMISAGVPQGVADSSASVGCILRGVADLWNYGSGSVGFSEYFKMRVTQLAMSSVKTETGADANV